MSPALLTAGLVILSRLRARLPPHARISAEAYNRLLLAALMLAQKTLCDGCHSAADWGIVGQGRYSTLDVSRMERELLQFVGWSIFVSAEEMSAIDVSATSLSLVRHGGNKLTLLPSLTVHHLQDHPRPHQRRVGSHPSCKPSILARTWIRNGGPFTQHCRLPLSAVLTLSQDCTLLVQLIVSCPLIVVACTQVEVHSSLVRLALPLFHSYILRSLLLHVLSRTRRPPSLPSWSSLSRLHAFTLSRIELGRTVPTCTRVLRNTFFAAEHRRRVQASRGLLGIQRRNRREL